LGSVATARPSPSPAVADQEVQNAHWSCIVKHELRSWEVMGTSTLELRLFSLLSAGA
jgi:hypothetical protein